MERPQRKHPRLKAYDYSQSGAYFVTTNVYGNRCLLSEIAVGRGVRENSRPTLMQVVGAFKSLSARQSNQVMGTPGGKLWQDSFYESVLQSEMAYQDTWTYIDTNPAKWAEDEYFI